MPTLVAYIGAAIAEIAGCFAFWAWLRLDKTIWWVLPGIASLALFAYLLTLVDSVAAGRAYAAYGGVYIVCSLVRSSHMILLPTVFSVNTSSHSSLFAQALLWRNRES